MKITRLLVLFCLIGLLVAAVDWAIDHKHAFARQSGGGFTIEQVLSSPFPSELKASPSGDRVAWVFDAQGRRNIWVAEGPRFKARQLTGYNEDTGQEITELEFTADGKWLVYVRGGNKNSAGEVPNPTTDPSGVKQEIFAVSYETGRVRRLAEGNSPVVSTTGNRIVYNKDGQLWTVEIAEGSEPHRMFSARGENFSPAWSPDGGRLAFVSSRNTHSLIGIYDTAKNAIRYLAPSVDRDSNPRWSPDGRKVAFIRQPARGSQPRPIFQDQPDPWAIMVADSGSGAVREIWRSGNRLEDSPPRMAGTDILQWAADDRIVFISEQDNWMHLYSIAAGGGEAKPLTSGACEYEQMTLTPDKREIIYASNCNDIDRRHLSRVNVVTGQQTSITGGEGIEWSPVVTASGDYLVYCGSNAQQPAMPRFRKIGAGGTESIIAAEALPMDFPAPKLVTPQQVIFKAADGLEIHGQLFLPKNAGVGEKLPSVIFMHGGPSRQMMLGWHNRYYYHNAYGFNQYLASRGYAVLSVNYRLGIGYGRAFRMAKNGGGRGASEYQDILAAAGYLRSRPEIDTARIGLWGGSYGGYLTALGLARNSDIFAAGVDLHGVHDWSLRISQTPWIDYADRDAARIARESSPIGWVDKWRSPVLLIHGDDDRNVAFAQTVDLVRRLRDRNVVNEVIVYPDEIHDFLLHRHWLEIYRASSDFLDRYLKNRQATQQTSQKVSKLDLLIRGGSVLDGTGAAAVRADIGVSGDRIVFVGDAARENLDAGRTIDAAGLIVSPGFIDPHTHTWEYLSKPEDKDNLNFLFQGVTTVMTGNDGSSPFPLKDTFDLWQRQGLGTNAALFVGHGTVRRLTMGMSDAPSNPEQIENMKQLVKKGMEDGAIGLSSGLYYAPGSYAKTEEVIELAKIAAQYGGIYDTHLRDESSYSIGLLGSIKEAIRISREANIPSHISHIKALGTDVWGQSSQVIEIINQARASGLNLTANQYPYTASGTGLSAALLPRWAEAGGREELLKRIAGAETRKRLVAEMEANLKRRGGANSLLITSSNNRGLIGKRLDQIAREMSKTPVDAALEIIQNGGAGVASFNMSEKDIENFMRQDWVMTGSDGGRSGHPRGFGTYPRKIREYILNRKIISLPRMIQASSLQVAELTGLHERGKIAEGYFADIIVFDEKTITDRATYEQPETPAEGMRYVIVNGQVAVDNGKYTGALAGRPLRKTNRQD